MRRQTIGNSMIAGILGIVLLAGCSTNPAPAVNPGMTTGKIKTAAPSDGWGLGGGMMGGGPSGVPTFASSEKSYGVVTFDRHDGGRSRSVIDWNGTSFSASQIFAYLSGSFPVVGGGLAPYSECLPQVSYLTVGDSGTVRFTRKNKDLFARITIRTRSGKIVSDPSRKVPSSCSQKVKAQKVENLSETILTKLVPMVPGKETRVAMGKTTVTVFIDKDFPVGKVPAYPAFSSLETGAFGGGSLVGGMGGLGMMGGTGVDGVGHGHLQGMTGGLGGGEMMSGRIVSAPLSPKDKKKLDAFTHCLHLYTDQPGKAGDKARCKKQFPFIDSQAKFYLEKISAEQLSTIMYGNTRKAGSVNYK